MIGALRRINVKAQEGGKEGRMDDLKGSEACKAGMEVTRARETK